MCRSKMVMRGAFKCKKIESVVVWRVSNKKNEHSTPHDSRVVPHPSTKWAHWSLASQIETGCGMFSKVWSNAVNVGRETLFIVRFSSLWSKNTIQNVVVGAREKVDMCGPSGKTHFKRNASFECDTLRKHSPNMLRLSQHDAE